MQNPNRNLIPARDLSVIEQSLVEDVAEQCQDAAQGELTVKMIEALRPLMESATPEFWERFALSDDFNLAIDDLLRKAIAAGYVWGTRAGYSAGYTEGVAMMKNDTYTKGEAVSQFYAAQRDTEFIDTDYQDVSDEALLRFYRPGRHPQVRAGSNGRQSCHGHADCRQGGQDPEQPGEGRCDRR